MLKIDSELKKRAQRCSHKGSTLRLFSKFEVRGSKLSSVVAIFE